MADNDEKKHCVEDCEKKSEYMARTNKVEDIHELPTS